MGELDYQMALLLQHRFEQEYESSKNEQKSDYELAKLLQEQFEQEEAIERPSNSLAYSPRKLLNSSKSLTDPSWELVDPTPDIHGLFMAFNQRYFWNKLLAVCVSWSKRMTTCAGICSYNGRGGLCSITLSEPLLKLRPRKDLIETLLHEMIHAYLFVTHNNKDRDGHGPEFHKHMYRINKESGTNITVYHNFHDEVRLYKQHWWRCNGPCQHRKPYFGMVRRATNRAPGPNDRWWGEHSTNCGGTFIKVKEPEKPEKKKKAETEKNGSTSGKSADIRSFLPVVRSAGSTSNIKSLKDCYGASTSNTKSAGSSSTSTSNIKGFKDLGTKVQGKFNSSSTIVVTKNTKTSDSFQPTVMMKGDSPKLKTETDRGSCSDDFLTVRNHWANKFSDTNKRRSSDREETKSKIPKTSSDDNYTECPVCSKRILMANLNSHLDVCLNADKDLVAEVIDLTNNEERKECPLCNKQIPASSFDVHVEKCIMAVYDNVEEKLDDRRNPDEEKEKIPCLACGKQIFKHELNSHLDDCMNDIFTVNVDNNGEDEDKNEEKEDSGKFNCPFCMKLVKEDEMKEHLDGCLSASDRDIVDSITDNIF